MSCVTTLRSWVIKLMSCVTTLMSWVIKLMSWVIKLMSWVIKLMSCVTTLMSLVTQLTYNCRVIADAAGEIDVFSTKNAEGATAGRIFAAEMQNRIRKG